MDSWWWGRQNTLSALGEGRGERTEGEGRKEAEIPERRVREEGGGRKGGSGERAGGRTGVGRMLWVGDGALGWEKDNRGREGVVPTICHFPHCVSAPLLAGPSLASLAGSHRDLVSSLASPGLGA